MSSINKPLFTANIPYLQALSDPVFSLSQSYEIAKKCDEIEYIFTKIKKEINNGKFKLRSYKI